jgi:hypothetical protein
MNKTELRQAMLQDVVTQFGKNPKVTRAISSEGASCRYSRTNNKNLGCAIGMYLPDSLAKKLDSSDETSVLSYRVFERLPKWMIRVGEDTDRPNFLGALQNLHDTNSYFNDKGFSKEGIWEIKNICNRYELDFKGLKFPKTR